MSMSTCTTKPTNIMALAGLKSKFNNIAYLSSHLEITNCKRMPVGFLTPADFYKSLLATAVLQQQQQQQQQHKSLNSTKFYHQEEQLLEKRGSSSVTNTPKTAMESNNVSTIDYNKPWSTNTVAAEQAINSETTGGTHQHHSVNHNNNNPSSSSSLISPSVTTTPTPPNLSLSDNFEGNRKSTPISSPSAAKRREELLTNSNKSNNNNNINNNTKSELLSHGFLQQCSPSNMPIGGVQSQNPTQGLVHWMSVMAEHMNVQSHHDPTPVGMHAYMWNGNVDCVQHGKEISDYNGWPPTTARSHMSAAAIKQGYEAKMNDHHNSLQKGHFLEDNRLDHHAATPQGSCVIGSSGAGGAGGVSSVSHHGNHVGHHGSAALLVVPQPINASKIGGGHGVGGPGTGRKYQCKMCPQHYHMQSV